MPYHKVKRPHEAHSFVLVASVSKQGVQEFSRVPFEIRQPPELRPFPRPRAEAERLLAYFEELDRGVPRR